MRVVHGREDLGADWIVVGGGKRGCSLTLVVAAMRLRPRLVRDRC